MCTTTERTVYYSPYRFSFFPSAGEAFDFFFLLTFSPFPPFALFPFAFGPFLVLSIAEAAAGMERELARLERRDVDRVDLMVPRNPRLIGSPSGLLAEDDCSYHPRAPYISNQLPAVKVNCGVNLADKVQFARQYTFCMQWIHTACSLALGNGLGLLPIQP